MQVSRLLGLLRAETVLLRLSISRACAVGLQFIVQIVVGALAGAGGLGILQLYTSWVSISGEVLALGLPVQAMKRVSIDYADNRMNRIRQWLLKSCVRIALAWAIAVAVVAVIASFMGESLSGLREGYGFLVLVALFTAPCYAGLRLFAESLKASGAALPSVTLENMVLPLVLLAVCFYYWLLEVDLDPLTLVLSYGLSLIILTAVFAKLFIQRIPPSTEGDSDIPIRSEHESSGREQLHFWSNSVLNIVFLQFPFLVMPFCVGTAEIGVFGLAFKLMNIITTVLILLSAIYGPAFARSTSGGDWEETARLLRKTQIISSLIFLPAACMLIALAGPVGKMFGPEFANLRFYLVVLSLGHLFNAVTGLAGVLLNMSGSAGRELATLIVALLIATLLSFYIGPRFGTPGLAIVYSVAIGVKNVASYVLVRMQYKRQTEATQAWRFPLACAGE